MKFQVFQALKPTFGFGEKSKFIPQNFEKVAVVDVQNIDEVFRVTNSIDYAWWENQEVEWYKKARSTSVGDVVKDENGKLFLCEMVGWEEFKMDELDYELWKRLEENDEEQLA